MKATVIVNARAGSAGSTSATQLAEMFATEGVEAEIRMTPGPQLVNAASGALGNGDIVVAAGGDGTISAVAGVLAGRSVPLGVLPLGTLNNFSKDLGIPQEPAAAVRAIALGRTRRVDVAEVNGRTFLNNSSIGLYPRMVSKRDELMTRRRFGKWRAMAQAGLSVLRDPPVHRVEVAAEGQSVSLRSTFVFVGNNAYDLEGGRPTARVALDDGKLCVWMSEATSAGGLARQFVRAFLGRLGDDGEFRAFDVSAAELRFHRTSLRVSADGEVVRMRTPLRYRVRPAALDVLVPLDAP